MRNLTHYLTSNCHSSWGLLNLYTWQADTEIIAARDRLEDEWRRWYEGKKEWIDWLEQGRKELLGDRLQEGEYSVDEVEAEVPMGPPQEEVVKL